METKRKREKRESFDERADRKNLISEIVRIVASSTVGNIKYMAFSLPDGQWNNRSLPFFSL